MRGPPSVQPSWALLVTVTGLSAAACTTTLDPTSLESSPGGAPGNVPEPTDDPVAPEEPVEPTPIEPGCPQVGGTAGTSFSECANLRPCAEAGASGQYRLCSHALSYEAAAYECRLRGGVLAELNSQEENDALAAVAWETVETNVWLGGQRSETFVWAWQNSQTVFWRGDRNGTAEPGVFVLWQPGEPNNSSTVSDEPEKCLALTLGDADWNDRACSLELPFACELR